MADLEATKQAKEYVEKALKVLPEEHRDREYFQKFLESSVRAEEIADNAEKQSILNDVAVKVANQITFILFRNNLLTDELEKAYRELPSTELTESAHKEIMEKRKEQDEALREKVIEAQNKQKEIDVFNQVLGGMTKEEAEARIAEYQKAGGM